MLHVQATWYYITKIIIIILKLANVRRYMAIDYHCFRETLYCILPTNILKDLVYNSGRSVLTYTGDQWRHELFQPRVQTRFKP